MNPFFRIFGFIPRLIVGLALMVPAVAQWIWAETFNTEYAGTELGVEAFWEYVKGNTKLSD